MFFANVHVLMEGQNNPSFRQLVNRADLVNPDGMPLVWALRAMGEKKASRVYGPDATEVLLRQAGRAGVPVGFYGGSKATLAQLLRTVRLRYPRLSIGFSMSPPYRALTEEEDEAVVQKICSAGVRLLFVGLGCPKQEKWIIAHRHRIPAVMLGVGAAFDFLAGTKPQAPRWMMRFGLEWIFRLCSEPRRLAGRYLTNNPRFVAFFLQQWIRSLPTRLMRAQRPKTEMNV